MARMRGHDGGADLDPVRLAPDHGAGGDRIEAEDVGDPGAGESAGLELPRLRDEVVEAGSPALDPDHRSDSHLPPPFLPRVSGPSRASPGSR
jgi:hypothetical protein